MVEFQPIWKYVLKSNWVHRPQVSRGENSKKYLKLPPPGVYNWWSIFTYPQNRKNKRQPHCRRRLCLVDAMVGCFGANYSPQSLLNLLMRDVKKNRACARIAKITNSPNNLNQSFQRIMTYWPIYIKFILWNFESCNRDSLHTLSRGCNATFLSPSWRSLNFPKGSLNHPKKGWCPRSDPSKLKSSGWLMGILIYCFFWNDENCTSHSSGWWFQPIWKILVNIGIFPK